jgi:hypothetical protein
VFEGDFWGETVAEFSHSLDPKRTFDHVEKPATLFLGIYTFLYT